MEPTGTGTRITESFDAERPLGPIMTWITEKWVGSSDRDADLHRANALDHVQFLEQILLLRNVQGHAAGQKVSQCTRIHNAVEQCVRFRRRILGQTD